jgi:trimeric autotransporter adhesin
MRLVHTFGAITIAALALAACNGGSGGGGGGPVPTTSPSGSPSTGIVAYVANSSVNTVTGYLALAKTPSITISSGVSSPVALAVDSSGDLFVDNCEPCITNTGSTSTITVYAQNSGVVTRTITAGLSKPVAMAVAPNGTLYVANAGTSTVTAYAAGSSDLAMTITSGVASPLGLAVDSSGNLYVANGAFFPGTVSVYSSTGTLQRTLSAGGVEGVAVDSTGRVYVPNCNVSCGNGSGADSVSVFAPNSTSIAYAVTTGLSFPSAVALDPSNNLYVANSGQGTANNVVKFNAGSGALIATIDAPGPSGLAFDANGVLYVTDGVGPGGIQYNQMTEYQSGSTITVSTGITDPTAVAVFSPGSSSSSLHVGQLTRSQHRRHRGARTLAGK